MSFNEALNDAPLCLNGEGDLLRHGAATLLEGLDQDKLAALEETLGQLYAYTKEKRWKKVPKDVLSSIWASCTAILVHGLSGVEACIKALYVLRTIVATPCPTCNPDCIETEKRESGPTQLQVADLIQALGKCLDHHASSVSLRAAVCGFIARLSGCALCLTLLDGNQELILSFKNCGALDLLVDSISKLKTTASDPAAGPAATEALAGIRFLIDSEPLERCSLQSSSVDLVLSARSIAAGRQAAEVHSLVILAALSKLLSHQGTSRYNEDAIKAIWKIAEESLCLGDAQSEPAPEKLSCLATTLSSVLSYLEFLGSKDQHVSDAFLSSCNDMAASYATEYLRNANQGKVRCDSETLLDFVDLLLVSSKYTSHTISTLTSDVLYASARCLGAPNTDYAVRERSLRVLYKLILSPEFQSLNGGSDGSKEKDTHLGKMLQHQCLDALKHFAMSCAPTVRDSDALLSEATTVRYSNTDVARGMEAARCVLVTLACLNEISSQYGDVFLEEHYPHVEVLVPYVTGNMLIAASTLESCQAKASPAADLVDPRILRGAVEFTGKIMACGDSHPDQGINRPMDPDIGGSLLHHLALVGYVPILKTFLEYGGGHIDLLVRNYQGLTAVQCATQKGHDACVDVLGDITRLAAETRQADLLREIEFLQAAKDDSHGEARSKARKKKSVTRSGSFFNDQPEEKIHDVDAGECAAEGSADGSEPTKEFNCLHSPSVERPSTPRGLRKTGSDGDDNENYDDQSYEGYEENTQVGRRPPTECTLTVTSDTTGMDSFPSDPSDPSEHSGDDDNHLDFCGIQGSAQLDEQTPAHCDHTTVRKASYPAQNSETTTRPIQEKLDCLVLSSPQGDSPASGLLSMSSSLEPTDFVNYGDASNDKNNSQRRANGMVQVASQSILSQGLTLSGQHILHDSHLGGSDTMDTTCTVDKDGNSMEPSPRIWLGNIAPAATTKTLHAVLGQFGTLLDAAVFPARIGPLGYAFVKFEALADAIRAYESLNNTVIPVLSGTKQLKMRYKPTGSGPGGRDENEDAARLAASSTPSRHLWLGNITQKPSEESIYAIFSIYGLVDSVRVFPAKAYAFVNYAELSAAVRAMAELEGVPLPALTGVKPLVMRYQQESQQPARGIYLPSQCSTMTRVTSEPALRGMIGNGPVPAPAPVPASIPVPATSSMIGQLSGLQRVHNLQTVSGYLHPHPPPGMASGLASTLLPSSSSGLDLMRMGIVPASGATTGPGLGPGIVMNPPVGTVSKNLQYGGYDLDINSHGPHQTTRSIDGRSIALDTTGRLGGHFVNEQMGGGLQAMPQHGSGSGISSANLMLSSPGLVNDPIQSGLSLLHRSQSLGLLGSIPTSAASINGLKMNLPSAGMATEAHRNAGHAPPPPRAIGNGLNGGNLHRSATTNSLMGEFSAQLGGDGSTVWEPPVSLTRQHAKPYHMETSYPKESLQATASVEQLHTVLNNLAALQRTANVSMGLNAQYGSTTTHGRRPDDGPSLCTASDSTTSPSSSDVAARLSTLMAAQSLQTSQRDVNLAAGDSQHSVLTNTAVEWANPLSSSNNSFGVESFSSSGGGSTSVVSHLRSSSSNASEAFTGTLSAQEFGGVNGDRPLTTPSDWYYMPKNSVAAGNLPDYVMNHAYMPTKSGSMASHFGGQF